MSEDKKLPAGMQMMLNMVIKALGIDPVGLINQATEMKTNVETGVKEFNARLEAIEKQAEKIPALEIKLEQLILLLTPKE